MNIDNLPGRVSIRKLLNIDEVRLELIGYCRVGHHETLECVPNHKVRELTPSQGLWKPGQNIIAKREPKSAGPRRVTVTIVRLKFIEHQS